MDDPSGSPASVRPSYRREAVVIVVFGLVASAALVLIDYLVGR